MLEVLREKEAESEHVKSLEFSYNYTIEMHIYYGQDSANWLVQWKLVTVYLSSMRQPGCLLM